MIIESEWERASSCLQSARRISVCCHISPDGDALGSMIGLASFLRRQGKQVSMSWGSPEIVTPTQYAFLPALDSIVAHKDMPDDLEVFVAIDCADKSRLDLLTPSFESAGITINIDHHVSNTQYASINLVDAARASSSEVAYELVKRMGGLPDSAEALCFYTGIVTDTGRFQYANTTPETLRTAADLRELGLDHQLVAECVYESESFGYLRVLGAVLSRAEMDGPLIWSWMSQDDLAGIPMEETDNLIDSLRVVRGAEIAALFKQQDDTEWKVSLRSRTEKDVSKIALAFGGGGHQKAAGFTVQGELSEVVSQVRDALK